MSNFLVITEIDDGCEYEHLININCIDDISISENHIDQCQYETTETDGRAEIWISNIANIHTGEPEGFRPSFRVKETYQNIKARLEKAGALI